MVKIIAKKFGSSIKSYYLCGIKPKKQAFMCFVTNSKKGNVKVAEKDIEVYKVVIKDSLGDIYSYYYTGFIWGNVCPENGVFTPREIANVRLMPFFKENKYAVTEGFHSYSNESIVKLYNIFGVNEAIQVNFNGHRNDECFFREGICIMKCVIPKGSEYCANEHGEYVSSLVKPVAVTDVLTEEDANDEGIKISEFNFNNE